MAEQKQASQRKPSNRKKQVEEPQPISAKVEDQAGSSQSRPSSTETVDKSELMKKYDERLEAAVIDAQYMMVYASTNCPNEIRKDITDKLIQIRQKIAKGEEIAASEESEFWQNYQDLWKLVQPLNSTGFTVTAESIKANMELEKTLFGRKTSRSRKAVNRYITFTAFVLILLLFFQIYWVVGNQLITQLNDLLENGTDLTSNLNTNQEKYRALELRYMQTEFASDGFDGQYGFYTNPKWLADALDNQNADTQFKADLDSLNSQIDRSLNALNGWRTWYLPTKFENSGSTNGTVTAAATNGTATAAATNGTGTSVSSADTANVSRNTSLSTTTDGYEEHSNKYKPLFLDIDIQIQEKESQISNKSYLPDDIRAENNSIDKKIKGLQQQISDPDAQRFEAISTFLKKRDEFVGLLAAYYSAPPGSTEESDASTALDNFNDIQITLKLNGNGTINFYGTELKNEDKIKLMDYAYYYYYNKQGFATQDSAADQFTESLEKEKEALASKVNVNINDILTQIDNLESQKKAHEDIMEQLKKELADLKTSREKLLSNEQTDINREAARAALLPGRSVLNILQGYILPILYGLLGASTYVLRSLARKIKEVTYSDTIGVQHILSIALGALAGIVVGWFSSFFGTDKTTFLGSVSPLAIAFLVGYNIEFFFSKMDEIINTDKRQPTDNKL